MRIKNKLLVLTILFISLYTIGLLVVITFMIQTRFLEIEAALANADIVRVVNAVKLEAKNLGVIVKDYAVWDETWNYVMGKNPDYIEENLGSSVYQNLGINILGLYDASGRKVFSTWYVSGIGEKPCAFCPEQLEKSDFAIRDTQHVSGFFDFNGKCLLVESQPIVHSDSNGPPAGFMIMGKIVDDKIIGNMHEQTGVFVEKVSGLLPADMRNPIIDEGLVYGLAQTDYDSAVTGYIQFNEHNGSPVLLLRTRTERALSTQSFDFAISMMLLFSVLTVFFIFAVSSAFRHWVSIPLALLEKEVDSFVLDPDIQPQPDPDTGIEEPRLKTLYSRNDEIGHIASVIKEMSDRVQNAHEAVRRVNENLETLVESRTADLVSVNTKLEMFRKILENTSEAVIITDLDGNIIDMNDAMCMMTGYSREELLGSNSRLFKSGRHDDVFYREMWQTILRTGLWAGELWDRKKDGSLYPKWQTINVIHDENGLATNYVGVSTDISVIKEAEDKLNHLAYYDPLTSLPNRMLFCDRLEHQIVCSKRNASRIGLLFIDLDRFKNVNDTLGHMSGDALLVQVAGRLKECIRSSDTLCRIGGDEFTLILQDLAREENAGMIASEVVHKMAQKFEVDGSDVYIGASIGIALFPKDGTDSETLLRKADAAMYLAKEAGRGLYRYASGEMEQANRGRLEIEAKMHKALEQNEFCLYYQPQTSVEQATPGMSTGLTGVEALIRWSPETDMLIPPGDFLPVAEETGFIAPLGDWVLYQACCDAKKWLDMGKPVQVSVNVAARQFDTGNFADKVSSVLATTGLPPALLKLEVTESGFMRNIGHVTDIMRKIRDTGVSFAIDDFGTGYCSLQYLNRLPVDCLKIDQSFIRSMDDSHSGGDIVSAVISMARAFGLSSIAEGVETFEQLEHVRARGCDIVQGYLISRPLPYDDFVKYLMR